VKLGSAVSRSSGHFGQNGRSGLAGISREIVRPHAGAALPYRRSLVRPGPRPATARAHRPEDAPSGWAFPGSVGTLFPSPCYRPKTIRRRSAPYCYPHVIRSGERLHNTRVVVRPVGGPSFLAAGFPVAALAFVSCGAALPQDAQGTLKNGVRRAAGWPSSRARRGPLFAR
jgi:hypothetical protein